MGVGGNEGSATALKPPLTLRASHLPLRLPVTEPERITDLFETVAATVRTSGSAPGEPTWKLPGPLLPAAMATTTPRGSPGLLQAGRPRKASKVSSQK